MNIELRASSAFIERLEELASKMRVSKAEVIRTAIDTLEMVEAQDRQGKGLVFVPKTQSDTKLKKVCKNCRYSVTTEIIDPITVSYGENAQSSVKEMMRGTGLLEPTRRVRCHYAGVPQIVDGDGDWCHQWVPIRVDEADQ